MCVRNCQGQESNTHIRSGARKRVDNDFFPSIISIFMLAKIRVEAFFMGSLRPIVFPTYVRFYFFCFRPFSSRHPLDSGFVPDAEGTRQVSRISPRTRSSHCHGSMRFESGDCCVIYPSRRPAPPPQEHTFLHDLLHQIFHGNSPYQTRN